MVALVSPDRVKPRAPWPQLATRNLGVGQEVWTLDGVEDLIVVVGAVDDVRPAFDEEVGEHHAVVSSAGGQYDLFGCGPSEVKEEMAFAGVHVLPVVGPIGGGDGVEDGRVESGDLLEAAPLPWDALGGPHQRGEHLADDAEPAAAVVRLGEGGASEEAQFPESAFLLVALMDLNDFSEGMHLCDLEADACEQVDEHREPGEPTSLPLHCEAEPDCVLQRIE